MANPFLQRLKGRARYGLLTQEILDRVARRGFQFMAYTIVVESAGDPPDIREEAPNCTVRQLTADDMALVASLPGRQRGVAAILARLNDAECLGVFVNGALAGYSWYRFDHILLAGNVKLLVLEPDEAYLFNIYIEKAHRGVGVAQILRHRLYGHLAGKGVRHFYSISSYFNRSTRKFKARLGARELELRFLLKLRSIGALDFRLKRYEANRGLATKRFYFVRG